MIALEEIFPLIILVIVLALAVSSGVARERPPGGGALTAAFAALFVAAVATIVENFVAEAFFDLLEHACRAASAVLVVVACVRLGARARDGGSA